jgi:hypothetical protein
MGYDLARARQHEADIDEKPVSRCKLHEPHLYEPTSTLRTARVGSSARSIHRPFGGDLPELFDGVGVDADIPVVELTAGSQWRGMRWTLSPKSSRLVAPKVFRARRKRVYRRRRARCRQATPGSKASMTIMLRSNRCHKGT